jgi:hypothetical protein
VVLLCNEASRGPSLEEIREVPLLRYVFAVSESDELANYRNQVTQAQRSIHTDMSRNRRQCFEIRDSKGRKNIGLRKLQVLTCILVLMLAGRNSPRCSRAAPRDPERTRGRLLREALQEMHAQDLEALTWTSFGHSRSDEGRVVLTSSITKKPSGMG